MLQYFDKVKKWMVLKLVLVPVIYLLLSEMPIL